MRTDPKIVRKSNRHPIASAADRSEHVYEQSTARHQSKFHQSGWRAVDNTVAIDLRNSQFGVSKLSRLPESSTSHCTQLTNGARSGTCADKTRHAGT